MSLYEENNLRLPIEFQHELPENFSGPVLVGARILYRPRNTYQIIIQEIANEFYSIRFNIIKLFEDKDFAWISERSGMHSRTMLKGNLHHKVKGSVKAYIEQDQFMLLWAEKVECSCEFRGKQEYLTFDIYYSNELLQQLTYFFPELQRTIENSKMKLLLKNPVFITSDMRDIIQQIINCPFDETTRKFYFDLKVREYLYLMLQRAYTKEKVTHQFTAYETECIKKAHDYLVEDLSREPPSVRALSRIAAINEFKLKVGFKQIFGQSIFGALHDARMRKAKELILSSNKPLKEICTLTGYPRITNFITAFRKKYGYTPGSLRRK